MNSFATLWESVLKKLESYYQANRNAIAYEMYIKSLSPAFEENGKYIFKVSNDLAREQVEERFAPLIFQKMKEAYQEMHGQDRAIELVFFTPAVSKRISTMVSPATGVTFSTSPRPKTLCSTRSPGR